MDACRIYKPCWIRDIIHESVRNRFFLWLFTRKSKTLECSGSMNLFTLWAEPQTSTPDSTCKLGSGLRCCYCAQELLYGQSLHLETRSGEAEKTIRILRVKHHRVREHAISPRWLCSESCIALSKMTPGRELGGFLEAAMEVACEAWEIDHKWHGKVGEKADNSAAKLSTSWRLEITQRREVETRWSRGSQAAWPVETRSPRRIGSEMLHWRNIHWLTGPSWP